MLRNFYSSSAVTIMKGNKSSGFNDEDKGEKQNKTSANVSAAGR